MNLENAKARRLEALSTCKSDRLLVAPAQHKSCLCLPQTGTVASYLIDALRAGWTIEQFAEQTEWPKSRIMANLYMVAKKTGIGIHRRSDRLYIVWPADCPETYAVLEDIIEHEIADTQDRNVAA